MNRARRHRQLSEPAGLITRTFSGAQLTVRAAANGERQRIIEGMAVPFDVPTTVRDSANGPTYREVIDRSAVEGIDPAGVLFEYLTDPPGAYNHHNGAKLVGRAVAADVRDDGLHMAFRVARTAAGDEALALADEGILGDLSVSFVPRAGGDVREPDGTLRRTSIDVRRVALVERGAYREGGAKVTAVRAAKEGTSVKCQHCGAAMVPGVAHTCASRAGAAPAAGATTAPAAGAAEGTEDDDDATAAPTGNSRPNRTRVTVDVERGRWEAFERFERAAAERETVDRMGATSRPVGRGGAFHVTRDQVQYGPGSGRSFFRDAWQVSRGVAESEVRERVENHYRMLYDLDAAIQRAVGFDPSIVFRAGDVLSSEIPGAYPSEYLPGLIVNRVLKQRPMGGFYQRFPLEDGRPRIYPVVSTSTSVSVQSAEGANPAASDFATTGTTVTPLFYGGETAVSRQVLDGADPSTDEMLRTDLNEAYMQASETVIKTAVEAGSTASGVTLTAATPDAGLRSLVMNHLGAVFLPAERLFVPTTLASSWIAQNDTTGRPLAPAIGAYNANGELSPNQLPIIGVELGVPVAQSWASTAGAGAGVGGVAVIGRASDFAIFESNIVNFDFREGAGAPASVRIGLWAYLVVGTRRGSRKATGA